MYIFLLSTHIYIRITCCYIDMWLIIKYVYTSIWGGGYIGCLNIHESHVTANNTTNNNVVLFFVSYLKIVYYNNY